MMKHVRLISRLARASSLAVTLAVLGAVAIQPAYAVDAKAAETVVASKIAVVDIQMLVSQSKAGKSIMTQLDNQRKNYGAQIQKQENELRNAEKTLIEQQAKLSKEEFAKKRKEFQEKVMNAQRSVQQRRGAFDQASTTALEKLREHIVKIVADISGKKGISLVLNRQEVVLVDAKMDMTKEVMDALNAKVSSILVTIK